MKKTITCIVCPRGCSVTADIQEETITVTGHSCPRGEQHAIGECTHPVRSLTSVIRVGNREDTMVPVKAADPVPKEAMFAILDRIRGTVAETPIQIGDILIPHIYGTHIVATKEIL